MVWFEISKFIQAQSNNKYYSLHIGVESPKNQFNFS